jgi:hypothetical protein
MADQVLYPPADSPRNRAKSVFKASVRLLPENFRTAVSIMRDFRAKFGYFPNILFPRTFNEKSQARKLFDRRKKLALWADKYAVREYVQTKLGAAVLPVLYHVTVDPSDIPFDKLSQKYVVKASHGSGWVQIVMNGQDVNRHDLIERCRYWLSVNYYQLTKEHCYKNITPRILIEEFLDPGTGAAPSDFKFFVFGGKTKFIQVDVDRYTNHKRNVYDTDWNKIDCRFVYDNCSSDIPKPLALQTMIDYAEVLSDGIDFVRVDLYELGGKVYFGELTNTPENGMGQFVPSSWDRVFGTLWR